MVDYVRHLSDSEDGTIDLVSDESKEVGEDDNEAVEKQDNGKKGGDDIGMNSEEWDDQSD